MTKDNNLDKKILLAGAIKKFRKINPKDIEKKGNSLHPEYSIKINGFVLTLKYIETGSPQENEDNEEYGLHLITNYRYIGECVERIKDDSLKELYKEVDKKITSYDNKKEGKDKRKFNRRLRKLERLLKK